jgi:hypothetical protein
MSLTIRVLGDNWLVGQTPPNILMMRDIVFLETSVPFHTLTWLFTHKTSLNLFAVKVSTHICGDVV